MKRTILAAVVVALANASPAPAQFVSGPLGPPVHRGGFVVSNGLGFSYQRPGFRVVGVVGGSSRSVFLSPLGPVVPVSPFSPFAPFAYGPSFFGSGFGSGFGGGVFVSPPPVFVVPPPIILMTNTGGPDPFGNENPNPNALGGAPPAAGVPPFAAPPPVPQCAAEEPQPPGKPGDFFVIEPKRKFPPPGGIFPEVDRVAGRPMLPPPIKFDPFAEPIPLKMEMRDADPVKEAIRLMKLGREAFAAGEYGKASDQFERAAAANPKAADPHFFKAQAAFAAGAYADAVAAIRAGLALDPDWPASTFDPKEPYGANAMVFAGHLADLRKVAAANPGEPVLEFLLGYELWFIGEKAEAKKWFAAAEKGLAAPGPIALFK